MTSGGQPKVKDPPQSTRQKISSWFAAPEPIKRLFTHFPLQTYPRNDLPRRSPQDAAGPVLHVFTTVEQARTGKPSYNPTCLKWQAYMKFRDIEFSTVPSNNHASPTGALPFVLTKADTAAASVAPVPSSKILKWTATQKPGNADASSMKTEAYTSLLDHRIRSAWLYTLYLDEDNFRAVAKKLYIDPTSSNAVVRMTIAYQLQQAARDELLKYATYVDEDDLYAEAVKAFQALSTLLGDKENFFDQEKPDLFDASVFAYTNLLLDKQMGWQNKRLSDALKNTPNLVQHRQRILAQYFNK